MFTLNIEITFGFNYPRPIRSGFPEGLSHFLQHHQHGYSIIEFIFHNLAWISSFRVETTIAYSIYSQLTSISGSLLPHPQHRGRAMPW